MEIEQEQLNAWLQERSLLYEEEAQLPFEPPVTEPDFSSEPSLQEGQIRLWPAWDGPFYGLLLSAGYGLWKVIPFSPISVPAVPHEARVREEPPVQVLQGWNLRIVPASVARESWVCGELGSEVWFWLRDWITVVEQGGDMPERFREMTGPRLRHPLDPRHAYLDQEAERADACLGESQPEAGSRPHSQAAEESGEYGKDDETD